MVLAVAIPFIISIASFVFPALALKERKNIFIARCSSAAGCFSSGFILATFILIRVALAASQMYSAWPLALGRVSNGVPEENISASSCKFHARHGGWVSKLPVVIFDHW